MKGTNRIFRIAPPGWRNGWLAACLLAVMVSPTQAHASIFKGEALDSLANVLAWVVLAIVPIVGIAAFWLVHILPEKIAEKKEHPQAKAIQCLCLLSLAFGGLLWPIAWLWAYSKPVLYKMAYGTDKVSHSHEGAEEPVREDHGDESRELDRLRQEIAKLEAKLAGKSTAK